MKGEAVLAITANRNDKAMLFSADDGRTFTKATPDAFMVGNGGYDNPAILAFSQNPHNPNSLLMLAVTSNSEIFGFLKLMDFGKNWRVLKPYILGYQNWVAAFNPCDTTNLYCA